MTDVQSLIHIKARQQLQLEPSKLNRAQRRALEKENKKNAKRR